MPRSSNYQDNNRIPIIRAHRMPHKRTKKKSNATGPVQTEDRSKRN